jgi:ABC-type nitrate/sulfonate/bicarbonate transport system substrate-binding protein/outer membrane protein OmpA-like peptidoglycan-associated protein
MTPKRLAGICLALLCLTAPAWGQVELFSKKVGPVTIKDVAPLPETGAFEMPFILWGGDVATFHANGGLSTKDGTIFAKQGLTLKLVPGDDFLKQVKDYVEGRSAFLRGTLSMLALASEVVGANEKTKPVVFLQMTWSRGDHMVARESLKTLNDLKGKKICLQNYGPHVGLLDDVLKTAGLTWKDITPVWVEDISGDKGPAETFRKDPSIDACFVISPDMQGLTGGLRKVGTGGGGTVKGAQVLVSTNELSRSIADVYACRKDFYDKHKDLIEKFAAGYLKACEDIKAMKPGKDNKGDPAAYKALCKLAVDVYGKNDATKAAVANEADADGLISDADFTGLQDNYIFFNKEKPDPIGFLAKMKSGLDLATSQGYASKRVEMLPHDLDFNKLKKMAELKEELSLNKKSPFASELPPKSTLKPIYSFVINFDPDQSVFPAEKYAADFQKAVEQGKLYGNAIIEIRGHADGTNLLAAIVSKGILKDGGGGKYTLKDGTSIELKDVPKILDAVAKSDLPDKADYKDAADQLLKLSNERAEKVRQSVLSYAKDKGYTIDQNQMKSFGVGVAEPVSMVLPRKPDEQAKNRRVEFRISALVEE